MIQSVFNASNYVNDQMSAREGYRNGNLGVYIRGTGTQISNESVVGINVAYVDQMRDAIRNYVEKIKTHLEGIEPLADANNAFKNDEMQRAVQNYIGIVQDYCVNLTSQLLAFSDKLGDVKNAYKSTMESLAEQIDNNTGSFATNSNGRQYQETIQ